MLQEESENEDEKSNIPKKKALSFEDITSFLTKQLSDNLIAEKPKQLLKRCNISTGFLELDSTFGKKMKIVQDYRKKYPGHAKHIHSVIIISRSPCSFDGDLGCVEFDQFLADHLKKFGNPGEGNISYLSANICNEFIDVMGKQLDLSRVDQLTFIIRYVKDGVPVERFLEFIHIKKHKSEYLAETIFNFLENHDIPINDCRGQSYDNALNMSGKCAGLQAKIKEKCEFTTFVPCAGHSPHRWELKQSCKEFVEVYYEDVSEKELTEYLKIVQSSENKETNSLSGIYHLLEENKIEDTFPNVEIFQIQKKKK
ncbi:hypothetical protein ILUMI_26873 [Ignelater luminosus]|uniref:DUF4371 domain-containing protein n=1 Tax=Ignelater luminosus TaxID=2038154 RepID=A0A8K0FYI4_IGNLU|nr:hypothetical protein ILUMI_26873 [Ignelater luminosus]